MDKDGKNLIAALTKIKSTYEAAIVKDGGAGTTSLIRSKKLIAILHEYIKAELVSAGVAPAKIFPPLGHNSPEIKMAGFLKEKDQDVSVLPENPKPEEILEGVLAGETDKLGKPIMSKSLCINIRSQLSSLSKNFDTLFERTFAEPLNLHLRTPELVMGELYMVPLYAYDSDAIERKAIEFREKLPIKYIPAFQELNSRISVKGAEHKYERVCLLIVDFRGKEPKVISSTEDLIKEGFIEKSEGKRYEIEGLTISSFIEDLLKIYEQRHGSTKALK
ncbi:MAG: hypothetical protein LVQ95_01680 [Candidatus Micrarchaeales archaeon]|nr:hypothetical protein [Candidatus Micrarchaeales archaeon]